MVDPFCLRAGSAPCSSSWLGHGMQLTAAERAHREAGGGSPAAGVIGMIAGHDWSPTSLGPRARWPVGAATMVAMILESRQPMFLLWGAERTLVYNDAYVPLLGAKHPSALGSPFLKVWEEAVDSLQPLVDRVFEGHANYMDHIHLMLDRGEGLREAHFSFSHSPVRDTDGSVGGLLCVCTETTAGVLAERSRKLAEERLRESEDNYRHAVELNPQVTWTAGGDGRIDRISERWLGLTGLDGLGDAWVASIHPEDVQPSIDAWTAARDCGQPFGIEHRVRLRSGEYRWFRSQAFPRFDADGNVVRWYGSTADIHDRRIGEDRLREIQSELLHMSRFTALGEMASALAHELNQPLAAISNYLTGCRELLDAPEGRDDALVRDAIGEAAAQALRAGEIIRSLRAFVSRAEARRQPVPLKTLVIETLALAMLGSSHVGVRVEVRIGEDLHVLVDRIQIQQVLLNIVRNAVEAMQGRRVRLLEIVASASPHDGMIDVAISDTGGGIHPAVAAKLFQPFQTTKPNGMGVGLSICRTIVEAHGGRILAEIRAAEGTTFRLSLPAAGEEGKRDAA